MDLYPQKTHVKIYVFVMIMFFIIGFIAVLLDINVENKPNHVCIKTNITKLNYSLDSLFDKINYIREWDYVIHNRPFESAKIISQHHITSNRRDYLITVHATKPIQEKWLLSSIMVTEIKNSYIIHIDLGRVVYEQHFSISEKQELGCTPH